MAEQRTLDAERADFEAWHRSKFATKHSTGQPTRDMHNGVYAEKYGPEREQLMWEAWQAARRAPVSTPQQSAQRASVDTPEFNELLESFANWQDQETFDALIAHINAWGSAGSGATQSSAEKA